MPPDRPPHAPTRSTKLSEDDSTLLARISRGDEGALRTIMDRYDRLVRYTIYRIAHRQSLRDPQWLDAVASETWSGFLKAVHRGARIEAGVGKYLCGIARQQTITALRRAAAFGTGREIASADLTSVGGNASPDPAAVLADLESLEGLRNCIAALEADDQTVVAQLPLITQKKWVEAGTALGISESTLRSRWARILEKLRTCMEKKTR